ncbi:MAG: UbiA family prenyltransferase [Xanthomonadales bacterium]|nr:UbiA family prenyltransferase [Xanthomonadales bacterium]
MILIARRGPVKEPPLLPQTVRVARETPRCRRRTRPPCPRTPAVSPPGWWRARRRRSAPISCSRASTGPVGTLLLLWPTWWALWLAAGGLPPWPTLLVFTAGVILMRAAGCAINDWADRWLDPQVARTRHRPLASGQLAPSAALDLLRRRLPRRLPAGAADQPPHDPAQPARPRPRRALSLPQASHPSRPGRDSASPSPGRCRWPSPR